MQFQLLNTESFGRIGAELSPHHLPGNYQKALYSTDYLERFVRSQTMSGHHPVGTCKMGSHRDLTAVVDSELKYAARPSPACARASVCRMIMDKISSNLLPDLLQPYL